MIYDISRKIFHIRWSFVLKIIDLYEEDSSFGSIFWNFYVEKIEKYFNYHVEKWLKNLFWFYLIDVTLRFTLSFHRYHFSLDKIK